MTNREKLQEFFAADSTMVKLRDYELYQLLRSLKPTDVIGIQEHRQLVELIAALRKVIERNNALNGANFNATLKSLLSVGDDGLYTDPLRFMFELIQNVDDCDYDDPDNVKLRIIICDNVIQFEYNECGFKPLDVFAITGIAEAVKNKDSSKVEIGEKGLGFKSVFGVASSVLIQSGLFSFRLNEENFTIPIPEYDGYTPIKGTRLTLRLKDNEAARKVCHLIKERYCKPNAIFKQNPMLFLNKLTVLEILVDNATKRLRFETVRSTREKLGDHLEVERGIQIKASLQAIKAGAKTGEFDETIVADRYTLSTLYTKDMCISRYGANTTLDDKHMRLQVIFPALQHLNEKNAIDAGALYSFLPTQIKINAPVIIHAPYKLDASREYVDSQNSNLWFKHTNKQLVRLLKDSYADVANRLHEDVLLYVPRRQKNDYIFRGDKAQCLELQDLTGAMLRNERIFWGTDQQLHIRGEVKAYAGNLPPEEQRRIHAALKVTYPLFVLPQGLQAKEYELPEEEDPYYMLVARSFVSPEVTTRALPILNDLVKSKGDKALFSRFEKFQMNAKGGYLYGSGSSFITSKITIRLIQVHQMAQFSAYAGVFSEWVQQKLAASMANFPFYFEYDDTTYDITKLGDTHFDINDVGINMRKYLQRIGSRCVLVQGDCLCVPMERVLVISKDNTLELFASFCKRMDKNSHFDITLRLMEMSRKLNDAENNMPVQEYLQLLKEVRTNGKVALGNSYSSYTKLLQQASPTPANFLNELFQNADDCKYPNDVTPTLTIRTSGQNFAISYNEKGFEKHNVRAITAIGESTKKRLLNGIQLSQDTIGEKGIGFKAVFAFAKHVDIHSNGFHFRLRAEEPTIPVLEIEEKNQDAAGTLMEMMLTQPLPSSLGFKDNLLSLCLCLRKIKRIVWNTIIIDISDSQGKRTITINGEKHEFSVYKHGFRVTDCTALSERRRDNKDISADQTVYCYIPAQRKTDCCLYNGLPTKIRINIPMFIDAPFELTTARDNVLDNNWNKFIRDQVYRAIYAYTNAERESLQIRALRYVSVRVENNIPRNNTFEGNTFLNAPSLRDYAQQGVFVPTVNKQLRRASETRKYPAFVRKWLEGAWSYRSETASALNYSDDEYNAAYFYLGGQDAKQEQILTLLGHYDLGDLLVVEQNRKQLYAYLEGLKTGTELVRQLRALPVWCVTAGRVRYVAFDDKPIYRVSGKNISDSKDYWVLNEQQMSPAQFYAITKFSLETMDHDHEVQIYKKKLLARISPSASIKIDAATAYKILLQESSTSKLFHDALSSMTVQEQKYIVMKNLQGEIVDSAQVFIGPLTASVFGQMLKHYIACPESYPMAHALNRPKLEEIQYGDVEDYQGILNNEDLEDLLSTESPQLRYGRYIAKAFYESGKVEQEAAEKHGLAYYMSTSVQSHNYQFPKGKVANPEKFRAEMRKRIQSAPKMKTAAVEKTVRGYIDPKKGTFTEVNHQRIHDDQMLHYIVPEKNKFCFCQMCKAVKRRDYIEVTCIQRELPVHLPMVYLVLCLECSKRYQGLISSKKSPFIRHLYQKILDTKVLNTGNVVVDMDEYEYKDVKVTFTDVHFIQIQTFVQSQVESGVASVSKPIATGHLQHNASNGGKTKPLGQKAIQAAVPENTKEVTAVGHVNNTTPKVTANPVLIQIVGEDAGTYKLLPYDGNIKSVTTKQASSRNILLKKGGAQKRLFVYLVKEDNAIYMPRMDYKKYGPALLHVDRIELKKTMYNMGWQK